MAQNRALLFGPLAALIFGSGVALLPALVPGYSAITRSVSEIGEIGSPMRWAFAVMLWATAACMFVFALGIWRARPVKHAIVAVAAVFCIGWMGVAAAAIGWFAHPHPLHNVFGISELIAYQAPLAFATAWRGYAPARAAVVFSVALYALTLVSLGFNLSIIFGGDAWRGNVEPVFGLVQRSLFACFFIWCFGVGWLLSKSNVASARPASA